MSQVVIDGIITNYYATPEHEGFGWLVILPGWKRSSSEWKVLADQLATKINVVVADFPGFGITSEPARSFDTYDYANFIRLFLEKLGIKTYTVFGHSFGGRVGIIMSNQANTAVKRLILVDPGGIDGPTLKIKVLKVLTPVIKLIKILSGGQKSPLTKLLGNRDYNNAGSMRTTFIKVVDQRLREQLKNIKIPVVVIWGDKDRVVSVENTKIIKKYIPGAIVRIVWGSGHSPHIEKPNKLLEIVEETL